MGHIIYVRKRYYVKSEGTNDNDIYKAVYDCMNSEGIKDPYPIYSTDDEQIKKIYQVIVKADSLEMDEKRPPKLRLMKPQQKERGTQTKDEIIYQEDVYDKCYLEDVSTITVGKPEGIFIMDHEINANRSSQAKYGRSVENDSDIENKSKHM